MKCEYGLAYVMLGRTERLEDIYISGKIDFEGISASKLAMDEATRLSENFKEAKDVEMDENMEGLTISCLNIRSLRYKVTDIMKTSLLVHSAILAFGETWLRPEENVPIDGFQSFFASHGKGKGVAVYSQNDPVGEPLTIVEDLFSMVVFNHDNFVAMFLYRSQNCDDSHLCSVLEANMKENMPIVVMGDMNLDYSKKRSALHNYLSSKGFTQEIKMPTCDTGSTLDHLYVNKEMKSLSVKIKQSIVYYSDHDIIGLQIKKF
jgi:hypothetical protein